MAHETRAVVSVVDGTPTSDGAGVKLERLIGSMELDYLDPFLLLDEFKSENSKDYISGFPSHPHRGMETVTYMIEGRMEHQDSMGNSGIIGPGDLQWMTAGSGIIHSEMPAMEDGKMWGFQLWVNLPASKKMVDPHYVDVKSSQIPLVEFAGYKVRVIAGEFQNATGPVKGIEAAPVYLDVSLEPGASFTNSVPREHNVFAYTLQGDGVFGSNDVSVNGSQLAVFGKGESLKITAGTNGLRFLLLGGQPLHEPVARGGPFVMNTRDEIDTAWSEYHDGTFIKKKGLVSE
jgi:quercetin 2,3-dioxygenase